MGGLGMGEPGDIYACDARIRRQAGQVAPETGPRRADCYGKLLSGVQRGEAATGLFPSELRTCAEVDWRPWRRGHDSSRRSGRCCDRRGWSWNYAGIAKEF